MREGFTAVIIIIGLFVIFTVIAYCFFKFKARTSVNSSTSGSTQLVSSTPSPILDYSKITVKSIIIKSKIDFKAHSQNPQYELFTAKGHYLFMDNGFEEDPSSRTITITYDGKVVYKGNSGALQTISKNGLHYAYMINNSLYVDGNKVTTTPNNTGAIALTDDGEYFYAYTTLVTPEAYTPNTVHLIKNNTEIYSTYEPLNRFDVDVSNDGQNYLLETFDKIIYNGKIVYSGEDRQGKLSENGKHYWFTGNLEYHVDNNLVLKNSGSILPLLLTNSGHYVYRMGSSTGKDDTFFVDGATISEGTKWVVITDDARHILIEDKNNNWQFDGKPIKVGDTKDGVEISGTTIYTYSVTN